MKNDVKQVNSAEETVTISRAEYESMQAQIQWLMEQLRLSRQKRFGASSEQTSEDSMEQLSLLFNEAEVYADQGARETEDSVVVAAHKRHKKHEYTLDELPEDIPVEVVEHRLLEEGLVCPPQLSILTINALSCADGVIIPVKTDYLAYRGLTQLLDSIQEIQELINPELKVLGVIATLYEKRVGDDNEILAALKKEYNLLGVIKRLAVAKKGIYDGLAVVEQTPGSEISIEYNAIADMMIADKYEREGTDHE